MADNIEIGFSIPIDPNFEELSKLLREIKEESEKLSSAMLDIPIDALSEKTNKYAQNIGELSLQLQNLNPNQKEEQQLISKSIDSLDVLTTEIKKVIEVKELWISSSNRQKDLLAKISEETRKSSDAIEKLVVEKNKLLTAEEEGNKLSQRQIDRLEKINLLIKQNSDTINENSKVLELFNSRVNESCEEIEKEIGFINQLKADIKELTTQLTGELEIDKKVIQAIEEKNIALSDYQKKISGTLELESQLNKVKENNIILENKIISLSEVNIDLKAKEIIANRNLAEEIEKRVAILTGSFTKEEEAEYKRLLKQEELNAKLIADAERKEMLEVQAATEKANKIQEVEDRLLLKQILNHEKASIAAQKAEIKQVEAAVKAAEAQEAAANKSIWSWENFISVFERMGLRMISSLIWWTAIIGAATALYEWWTKIDDATQMALDRLKDYINSFDELQKLKAEADAKYGAKIEIDINKSERLIAQMKDSNNTLDERFNKYKELQSMYPKIFDAMDKETFKLKENSDRMNDMIKTRSEYIVILQKEAEQQEISDKATESKYKLIAEKRELSGDIIKEAKKGYFDELQESTGVSLDVKKGKFSKDGKQIKDDEFLDLILATEPADKDKSWYKTKVEDKIRQLNEIELRINEAEKDESDSNEKLYSIELRKTKLEGNNPDKKAKKSRKPFFNGDNDAHKIAMAELKEDYDQSKKSFDDKIEFYRLEDLEVNRHYAVQEKMIKDFNKISGESLEQQKHRLEQNAAAQEIERNKIEESRQKDLEKFRQYESEKLKLIEETQRNLIEFNRKVESEINSINENKSLQNRRHKRDSRFNVIGAFLGTGGGSKQKDYEDSLEDFDDEIGKDKSNLFGLSNKGVSADLRVKKAKNELDEFLSIPDNKKSESQLEIQKQKQQEYNSAILEQTRINEEFTKTKVKLDADEADKVAAIDKKKKDDKIKLATEIADATSKIANTEFDAQRKRIQNQMSEVQAFSQFELRIAGNNALAKERIARDEHDKILALKRKQAEIDKEQGIFNATISTAKGVAAALGEGPVGIPIAAFIAAAGLEQIIKISNEKLPAYKTGRKGGIKESAKINEEGFELVESNGKFNIFGGGKETIANLESGDTVHTHKESMDILKNNFFLNSLLYGDSLVQKRDDLDRVQKFEYQKQLTKEDLESAFTKAISKMPKIELTLPARDVEERHQRQQLRNGL